MAELAHAACVPRDRAGLGAASGDNLRRLQRVIVAALPVGAALFPPDQVTDRSERFRIAEIIREKLTLELARSCRTASPWRSSRSRRRRTAQLRVSARDLGRSRGQKPIVIGAGGERLKRVGRAARLELNRLLGERFHLTLWVKVREDWADDARALQQLGLE